MAVSRKRMAVIPNSAYQYRTKAISYQPHNGIPVAVQNRECESRSTTHGETLDERSTLRGESSQPCVVLERGGDHFAVVPQHAIA